MMVTGNDPFATPTSPPPAVLMMQMITGKWISQAVYAAAELGIHDQLAGGARSSDELAAATGTDPDALYRLLRALGGIGVLAEEEGRRFRNTPLGELLRQDAPASLRGLARLMGMDVSWRAWGDILHSVRTGGSAALHVTGGSLFDHLGTHPQEAAIFNAAMDGMSAMETPVVVQAYDFSDAGTIVDVGGGHGLLLAGILESAPSAQGVLFELPHAAAGASALFARRNLASRVQVITGNALEAVWPGGDVYLMKHIVHDWDDAHALRFMRSCADAMRPGGRLLLVEIVLTQPGEPHFSKILDLEMLVMGMGGRERTAEEYRGLYQAAGLELTRIVPTVGLASVIEGVKR